MAVSLKDLNRVPLASVLALNAALYVIVTNTSLDLWGIWPDNSTSALAPAILAAVTGVLNSQIDHDNKARLVFWRWSHPLPGTRAFSVYMHEDPRVDREVLTQRYGPLPAEPEKQNALWFKWYREYRDEPETRQVHREYLFARDWASISLLMLAGFSPAAFWQMGSPQRRLSTPDICWPNIFLFDAPRVTTEFGS